MKVVVQYIFGSVNEKKKEKAESDTEYRQTYISVVSVVTYKNTS